MDADHRPQLRRLAERDRPALRFRIDGEPAEALQGDTLLTALLVNRGSLRDSEFGDGRRAGFCLMGACQDCWVWTVSGERLRACTTYVTEGMDVLTRTTEAAWPGP